MRRHQVHESLLYRIIISPSVFCLIEIAWEDEFAFFTRPHPNPFNAMVISKPLEMSGKSTYILACSIVTALDSDISPTDFDLIYYHIAA